MKKGMYSKLIIMSIILLNILFTVAVLYVSLKGGIVPDSLIVSWFGFTTGELWMLSSIKKKKVENNAENGQ